MKVEITKDADLHFKTAQLLMEGLQESMKAQPNKWGSIPPEHSAESIKRRLVQVRQELLQVAKGVSSKF